MADTGNPRSPALLKGALVQLVDDVVTPTRKIISFQYNPEKLSRTITPWDPFQVDDAGRGQQAPNVQPFDPKETINITLELDATDQLEDDDPDAVANGIDGRIAAIEQLLLPEQGLAGALATAERTIDAAAGTTAPTPRATVPILLFVFGPGRVLPVRITSYSIDEELFSPTLHPIQAKVTLALQVLTPDVFKCSGTPSVDIAISAYNSYRRQRAALADRQIANNKDTKLGLQSF
jgi:hypothetical protein